jgi:hypothetical protein
MASWDGLREGPLWWLKCAVRPSRFVKCEGNYDHMNPCCMVRRRDVEVEK